MVFARVVLLPEESSAASASGRRLVPIRRPRARSPRASGPRRAFSEKPLRGGAHRDGRDEIVGGPDSAADHCARAALPCALLPPTTSTQPRRESPRQARASCTGAHRGVSGGRRRRGHRAEVTHPRARPGGLRWSAGRWRRRSARATRRAAPPRSGRAAASCTWPGGPRGRRGQAQCGPRARGVEEGVGPEVGGRGPSRWSSEHPRRGSLDGRCRRSEGAAR